jgi:hypothetical protein
MTPEPQNGFGVFFFQLFLEEERAFLLGVSQILVCRTWFFDGYIVVDLW